MGDEATAERMVGVFVRPEEARVYPAGRLANPVVGDVDVDERGIYGVEALYDDVMTGIPGEEEFESSRFGSISVADWKVSPATAGYDVVLAIDHRIQYVAEEALRAPVRGDRCLRGHRGGHRAGHRRDPGHGRRGPRRRQRGLRRAPAQTPPWCGPSSRGRW